jgi:hypothetical protein
MTQTWWDSAVEVMVFRTGTYTANLSVWRKVDASLLGRALWNMEISVQAEGERRFVPLLNRRGQAVERRTFTGFVNVAVRMIIERRVLSRTL